MDLKVVIALDLALSLWRKRIRDLYAKALEQLFPLRVSFVSPKVQFLPEAVLVLDEAEDTKRVDIIT